MVLCQEPNSAKKHKKPVRRRVDFLVVLVIFCPTQWSDTILHSYIISDVMSFLAAIVEYVREYLLEGWNGRGFVEQLEEDDGRNYVGVEACSVDGGLNDVIETNECSQENKQIVNGDSLSLLFPRVESPQFSGQSAETYFLDELHEKNDFRQEGNTKLTSGPESSQLQEVKLQLTNSTKSFLAGKNGKKENNTMIRKKKRAPDDIIIKPKISSLFRKIQLLQESLSENRGEGEWKIHDDTIERVMKEYNHDDDNHDIMLLLYYEKAVGLYQRNQTTNSSEYLKKIHSKIGGEDLSTRNEKQKMIYVRCVLLASEISCQQKKFGRAEKALKRVRDFLISSDSALLKTEFHVAQARYYLRLVEQQNDHSRDSCIENVIKETNEAERVAGIFKNTKIWTTLRMEILLTRSNAILKLPQGDDEEYAETLKDSLDEINHTLYDKSLQIAKVNCRYLMCCYYKSIGNLEQAVEQAKVGLEIADRCGFPVEKEQVIKKIEEIENSPGFKKLSCKDSAEVVHDILHLNTTDNGNVESNAVEQSSSDIFSTDAFSDDEENLQKLQSIEEDEGRPRSLEQIIGNSSCEDLVADEGDDLNAYAHTVHVPADNKKLSEREQTRLATHLGSLWMQLLGLLNIVPEKKEEILRDVNRYPNIKSCAKEVLHIYNEQNEFSRENLAKLVEQDLQLHEQAEAITSGRYQSLEENKESKTFECIRGAEFALDDHLHGTQAGPEDNEKLTEREQTRLAKHLSPHWSQLSGLLNIDDDIRRNIMTNVYYYPDNMSKAKEILYIYNKHRGDFSRKNLAELVEQDLKLFEEAEAIRSGTYQSI